MTILDDIISYKTEEVLAAKTKTPLSDLDARVHTASPIRPFQKALEHKAENGFALIAEVKKKSPSKGLIREDFNPAAHAQSYEKGGAACLSVLTDHPSFGGDPAFLVEARAACTLPVLRKDFMIDPYQVAEARAWGADCILLIMACLDNDQCLELMAAAKQYDLDCLVEVHDTDEMNRAINVGASLIGVNNRNLKTFETSLDVTRELSEIAPQSCFLVSESGIRDHKDLQTLTAYGASAFLVGESLMRCADVETATRTLLGQSIL